MDLDAFGVYEEWHRALSFFDDGDPSELAKMLRSGRELPDDVRQALADVVEGKRRPQRGRRNLLTYDQRLTLRMVVLAHAALFGPFISGTVKPGDVDMTPAELKAWRADHKRTRISTLVERFGVSESTIQKAWNQEWRRWNAMFSRNRAHLKSRRDLAEAKAKAAMNRLW